MDNDKVFPDDDNDEKCTCDKGHKPHLCPYDEDSEFLCTCCPVCTQKCAD